MIDRIPEDLWSIVIPFLPASSLVALARASKTLASTRVPLHPNPARLLREWNPERADSTLAFARVVGGKSTPMPTLLDHSTFLLRVDWALMLGVLRSTYPYVPKSMPKILFASQKRKQLVVE